MKRLLFALLLTLGLALPVQAATYYIDDAGSDAAAGTATGTAWKTFDRALVSGSPKAGCGDTLIVMDGTYTIATNGTFRITLVCTVGNVLTVQAQNQRAAFLQGTGHAGDFRILNSAYIVIDGLRIEGMDSSGANLDSTVRVQFCNHITFKNSLLRFNNRYLNGHLLQFSNSTDNLIEGNELYSFHRHGIVLPITDNSVVRRNYCNSRDYANIPGGYVSDPAATGDDCFIAYPGDNNIFENNIAEGGLLKGYAVESISGGGDGNKFYGNISLGAMQIGLALDARGSDLGHSPENTIITDFVAVGAMTVNGIRLNGAPGTICTRCTIIGGIDVDDEAILVEQGQSPNVGGTPRTFFMYDSLISSHPGKGLWIKTAEIATWSVENSTANGNGTNYDPASHANYNNPDTPFTTDPQMGNCYLWAPDGSAAATNNWGARILYRYVDGILTGTPLWDPTTGEFPHGAIVAGVNDIDGSSAYNVHTRLHVNSGGCAFPASFTGGSPPADGANYVTSETSPHDHVIDAGMDFLGVCVSLWDDGAAVGSVTGVTSGGEALTLAQAQTTSPAYRRAEFWYKLNPTSGTRSIAVTTTGTVDGMIITSMEHDNIASVSTSASATNTSSTPSVTVATNTGELIVDCLSSGKQYTVSAGANQTLQRKDDHSTQALRLATGTQSGTDGGVISYTNGGDTTWALTATSLCPTGGCTGATWELRQTHFRFHNLYGTEAAPEVLPRAGAANDVNLFAHPTSMFRLRFELTAFTATSPQIGMVLYCRKNADSYSAVLDTFSGKVFRLFGAGTNPDIPSSLTPTTQQLGAGNYNTGQMIRSEPAVLIAPSLIVGNHTEIEQTVVLNAAVGDTIDCRLQQDSGATITYTVTPQITVRALSAGAGF